MDRKCRRGIAALGALLLGVGIALSGCGAPRRDADVQVFLDGERWRGDAPVAQAEDDLRVYVTLDGETLIELPFSEAHTVKIRLPGGGENTVAITGDAVYMESADCDNQDCVNMGAVTRDNLEMRVMGGFIICLPHRISVEVRGD